MNARRAAYIALKVLSLYLGIRAVESIASTVGLRYRPQDVQGWFAIGASVVPLIGAIVLWLAAQRLATSLGDVEPMTLREIDAILAREDTEADDSEEEAEPAIAPAAHVWRPLLMAALVVLGAFSVIRSIEFAAFNAGSLALHKQASFFCNRGLLENRPRLCPFWDPESVRNAVSLGAELITVALGVWLVANPAAFLGTVERAWSRIRRRSETEDERVESGS
jgi:hypothetical protein